MINVSLLTLTYPSGKGVFELDFTVPNGAVMGYLASWLYGLLMNMLGGSGPGLELLSSMSIFGFYDPREIVAGASTWGVNTIYVALIVALFAAGTIIFNRKRLPL